jgi:hypothetical protein
MASTEVQVHDVVLINDSRTRVAYVGRGSYAIAAVDGFELDRTELTLVSKGAGHGDANTWRCRTGADGRRA